MRSRGWVVVTVVLILAVVFAGISAALLTGGGSSEQNGTPSPAPSEVTPGIFDLRQVLFQESGETQRRPPLPPGPDKGGKNAVRNLQRVDCNLPARPMAPGDNVILCDSFGFRYGLGPSELVDVSERFSKERAEAGATILRQGDPGEKFYLISGRGNRSSPILKFCNDR